MRINQNIAAQNAYRNLTVTSGQMGRSLEKLSSGFRINRAADDAAGLAISEGLRSQVGGLKVAVRNAQDGISVVQTAEGALTEVHALLQRTRDLAVQAASTGGNSAEARAAAATEVEQAMAEINRISQATEFGGKKLLDGSETNGFTFHVGSGAGAENRVQVDIGAMNTSGLGLEEVTTAVTAVTTGSVDAALDLNFGTAGNEAVYTGSVVTNTRLSYTGGGSLGTQTFDITTDAGTSTVTLNTNFATAADKLAEVNAQLAAGGADVTASYAAGGEYVFTTNTATASTIAVGGANAGTEVGTLTQTQAGVAPDTTENESFTVTVGDAGTAQTVNLTTTYASVAAKLTDINSQLTGVTATQDASTGALVFTADAPSDGTIDIGGPDAATVVGTTTQVEGAALADGIKDLVAAGSADAISRVDSAITAVSTQRANLGAYQNRLEHTIANLSVTAENLSASESRIRDTDMAQEMVSFTRAQILTQAGTSMLAQANQAPQSVLSLLR